MTAVNFEVTDENQDELLPWVVGAKIVSIQRELSSEESFRDVG